MTLAEWNIAAIQFIVKEKRRPPSTLLQTSPTAHRRQLYHWQWQLVWLGRRIGVQRITTSDTRLQYDDKLEDNKLETWRVDTSDFCNSLPGNLRDLWPGRDSCSRSLRSLKTFLFSTYIRVPVQDLHVPVPVLAHSALWRTPCYTNYTYLLIYSLLLVVAGRVVQADKYYVNKN